jgi:hypothetical protein
MVDEEWMVLDRRVRNAIVRWYLMCRDLERAQRLDSDVGRHLR